MVDHDQILRLRLENKTMEQIATQLQCSRSLVGLYLKKIYKKSDQELQFALDAVRNYLSIHCREKITDITDYQLGIIWAIGSYIESEGYFCFRHRNRYFVEQLEILSNYKIRLQVTPKKTYYVLNSHLIDINYLCEFGWHSRNTKQRDIPLVNNHHDFLRSYIEIHSSFDYCTAYTRKGDKYKKLRLRIYGNKIMMESVSTIISEGCNSVRKKVQRLGNEISGYLSYTSYSELQMIFDWLIGDPCCQEWWEDIDRKMKVPIIK